MEPNVGGEVWCVTVPSGVIVVRRNGFSMLCGNCAESHALRKAFPAVLSGTYTAEEMDQANAIEVSGRVVDASTGEITGPAPVRTPPAARRQSPEEENRERLRGKLHALTSHDTLHNWAVEAGYPSFNDVPIPDLAKLANEITKPAGRKAFEDAYAALDEVIEAEAAVVEPAPEPLFSPEDQALLDADQDRIAKAEAARR